MELCKWLFDLESWGIGPVRLFQSRMQVNKI